MRLKTPSRAYAVRLFAGVGLIFLLSACSDLGTLGAREPVTTQGDSILSLWQLFVVAAAVVGVVVFGLIFYVIIRFRRKDDELPPQNEGNNTLEVVYTAVPILIVIGLFGFTMATQLDVDQLSEDPDVVVEVIGFQWQWQFNYLNEGISVTGGPEEQPEMVLPVGSTVRFKLHSRDVIHSFFVPTFLFKRDVIPGVDNEFDATVTQAGTFTGHCTEFCGLLHDSMDFTVRTVDQSEYDAWVEQQTS